jgi:hypothetical protein
MQSGCYGYSNANNGANEMELSAAQQVALEKIQDMHAKAVEVYANDVIQWGEPKKASEEVDFRLVNLNQNTLKALIKKGVISVASEWVSKYRREYKTSWGHSVYHKTFDITESSYVLNREWI